MIVLSCRSYLEMGASQEDFRAEPFHVTRLRGAMIGRKAEKLPFIYSEPHPNSLRYFNC